MDTIFKIPEGVDSIEIKVTSNGKEYDLPAIRVAGENGTYRIPHKALSHLWRILRNAQKGLKMETGYIDGAFVGTMTPGYTCVGCRISDATRTGDVYYGETKASNAYSTAEREAPFTSAVNRAQDKAILDYLGLESQYFTADGAPSLYSFDTGYIIDEPDEDDGEASAEESNLTVHSKEAQTGQTDTVPGAGEQFIVTAEPRFPQLTEAEAKDLEALKATRLNITVKGENKAVALEDMDDKTTQFLASDNHGNDAYRTIVRRYLSLRAKAGMAQVEKALSAANGGV